MSKSIICPGCKKLLTLGADYTFDAVGSMICDHCKGVVFSTKPTPVSQVSTAPPNPNSVKHKGKVID